MDIGKFIENAVTRCPKVIPENKLATAALILSNLPFLYLGLYAHDVEIRTFNMIVFIISTIYHASQTCFKCTCSDTLITCHIDYIAAGMACIVLCSRNWRVIDKKTIVYGLIAFIFFSISYHYFHHEDSEHKRIYVICHSFWHLVVAYLSYLVDKKIATQSS